MRIKVCQNPSRNKKSQVTNKMKRQIDHMSKPNWLDDSDFRDLTLAHASFAEFEKTYARHPNMEGFATSKAVSLVYCSNKLEDTLPQNAKQGVTFKILGDIASGILTREVPEAWDADGSGPYSRAQMIQHMLAYKYLVSNVKSPLSVAVVLETHRLLMDGSKTKDGEPVLNGKFRTFGVNNGVEDYINHALVLPSLQATIDRYNGVSLTSDPIGTASRLLFEFLTVHPFQDGNGRMGRLLVAYALMQHGTPFPVLITSGRNRSRKHFHDAIKRAGCLFTNTSPLSTLIAFSVYLGWKNFINQLRVLE